MIECKVAIGWGYKLPHSVSLTFLIRQVVNPFCESVKDHDLFSLLKQTAPEVSTLPFGWDCTYLCKHYVWLFPKLPVLLYNMDIVV